jgi:hypothetical protein
MKKKEVKMINEIAVSLFLVSIVFIIWIVSSILFSIKKKKGIISFIMSLVFTFFAGYYIYLVFYVKPVLTTFEKYGNMEKVILKPKIENPRKSEDIFLIFQINGNNIRVGIEDEIEIKKNTTFVISDIEGIDKENLKINLVGFVGNPKYNDGQDMGYKINYKDIRKDKEIGKDKFEIEIKKDEKKIGSVYIKFVD